jgi:hypothetical protein
MNNYLLRLSVVASFSMLAIFSGCGGGEDNKPQVKSLTEILQKGGVNDNCYASGLNDQSDVLFSCSRIDGENISNSFPVILLNSNEIKVQAAPENVPYSSYYNLANNGAFIVSPAIAIDSVSGNVAKARVKGGEDVPGIPFPIFKQPGVTVWTGNEYKSIDNANFLQLSDSGEYFSVNSIDGNLNLFKDHELKSLLQLPVGFSYRSSVKPTNSGVIYSELYNIDSDSISNQLFFNSEFKSGLVESGISSKGTVSIIAANNKNSLLLVDYSFFEDGTSSLKYYIKRFNGDLIEIPSVPGESYFYASEINDNEVVLINASVPYVYTVKGGLKKITDIVSFPSSNIVSNAYDINNRNEIIVSTYREDIGLVTDYLASLGDL